MSRKHVYSDLRPYVCLEKDCTASTSEQEFSRRHEWIRHAQKTHWNVYTCLLGCTSVFHSPSAYGDHLHKAHPGSVSEGDIETLTKLAEQPLGIKDGIPCPFCGDEEILSSEKDYQRHVGRHQEQLALFALPRSLTDHDDEMESDRDDGVKSDDLADDRSIDIHGERENAKPGGEGIEVASPDNRPDVSSARPEPTVEDELDRDLKASVERFRREPDFGRWTHEEESKGMEQQEDEVQQTGGIKPHRATLEEKERLRPELEESEKVKQRERKQRIFQKDYAAEVEPHATQRAEDPAREDLREHLVGLGLDNEQLEDVTRKVQLARWQQSKEELLENGRRILATGEATAPGITPQEGEQTSHEPAGGTSEERSPITHGSESKLEARNLLDHPSEDHELRESVERVLRDQMARPPTRTSTPAPDETYGSPRRVGPW
jgi:uncharacterized C2H2 Zn-finger protein